MNLSIRERLESPDSYVSLALGLAVVLILGFFVFRYIQSRRQTESPANSAASEQSQQNNQNNNSYTVAKGDTLWSIAEKTVNSGYNWVDIAKANNLTDANKIEVGQTLIIPIMTPIVPQGQVSSTSIDLNNKPSSYTVLHGDTLWNIALKFYGSGFKWTDLAKANKLTNPDVIHSGNVLTLP